MANILPFTRRGEVKNGGTEDVSVDVDGDGIPDQIFGPRSSPEGTIAVRHDLIPSEVAAPDDQSVTIQATVLTPRPGELRPIVVGWLKSPQGRRAMVRWWSRKAWHAVRYYAVRLPMLTGRVLWRAPVGMYRVIDVTGRWAFDTRADAMEQELASGSRGDAAAFLSVREDRAARIKFRLALTCLALLAVLVSAVLVFLVVPGAGQVILLVVLVGGLARFGSPPGKPLMVAMMIASPRAREMTDTILMRGLRAAGLGGSAAKIDKAGVEIQEDTRPTLAAPIARSANGRGYEVLVDLPFGKTAGDAARAVEQLASGIDTSVECVFPEPVPGRARRVALYVADEDPFLLPPRRSPLAKLPKVSIWDDHPLGTTPTGRELCTSLLFRSFLIGAVPRSGKTFAGRALVAPALLDPFADLSIIDCKGGRDWLAAADLAVNFRCGDEPEDLAEIVAMLTHLQDGCRGRFAEFRKLSDAECPESKLTRELAERGMHPHVIVVDEVQNLLTAEDKTVRKAALSVLIWLAKTAPAAGYTLVMLTQRPAVDVIPGDLRENCTVRIALRTKTWQASDAILGQGMNAAGYGTARFIEDHKGAAMVGGISNGQGGDNSIIRTDLLTQEAYTRLIAVGRQRRIDAGTLRGAAAGDAPVIEVTVTIVADVAAVWPGAEAKVQAHVLLSRLREVFGDRYAGLDETGLTRALKPYGVGSGQVFRDGSNRNGYSLTDLKKARTALEAD